MLEDFSWDRSAAAYQEIYRQALAIAGERLDG
jgi:glycogen synthase